MSLFGDIANALGHTVDSLAQEVGEAAGILESLVSEFDSNGIDVITVAAKLNLPVASFLRSILDIMGGDPHQRLLQHIVSPVQPTSGPINGLASQWLQMGQLHQNTAQQINTHMNDLFLGSTTDSYKSPAADALLSTHQDYQSYFTTLVDHAQTQQGRHATLGNHVDDYLSQAPGKVYSLSAPMAALGVLSLNTATFVAPPPPWIDPGVIQGAEDNAQNLQGDAESTLPGLENPWWDLLEFLVLILYIFVGICMLINWIQGIIQFFQGQQKSTPPPKKSLKPGQPGQGPLNNLTPAQERLHNDVKSRLGYATYDDAEIDALIRAGYLDPDAIAAIMRGGYNTYSVFNDVNIANMMNGLTTAQQLKFITIVEQYQKAHPGLTTHQVYNYLRFTKMKAQSQLLANNIQSNPIFTDPAFSASAARFLDRLNLYALNSMNAVSDPFAVTDGQLGVNGGGWYANVTGLWGEWSMIKHYYATGQLSDFSMPITARTKVGEVDIILKDGTWIEVKNILTLDYGSSSWSTLKREVTKYIDAGATKILIELPQGLPPGNRDRMVNQLQAMGSARGVTLGVEYPAGIPFDPPAGDWGSSLPAVTSIQTTVPTPTP